MKEFKKLLAGLLAVIMVFGSVPFATAATGNVDSDSELEYSASGGMGKIINNLSADAAANKSDDYYIVQTEMNGNNATVTYSAIADCKVIVAVFDENSGKMIGSGNAEVLSTETEATVTIDCSLPTEYVLKSYLVASDLTALGAEYVDLQYTSAYQEFLDVTPEDYSEDKVVAFDEEQEDFGVLNDTVVSAESSATMTYTYDEATMTYIFENATDEIKALKVGEIFYYEYGENLNEFILFKVKSIKIDGSRVTVVEDENITLYEVFKYIRIDEEADFSQVEIDEDSLGECLTEVPQTRKAAARSISEGADCSFSHSFAIKYSLGSDGPVKATINGKLEVKMSISVKLHYAPELFGKDYCEFNLEINTKSLWEVSVSGKIALDKEKVRISVPLVEMPPFSLTLNLYPVLEFSGSISLSAEVEEKTTYSFDSNTKELNKVKETDMIPDVEIKEKAEFKIGVGLQLKLALEIVKKELVSFSVSGEGGAKATVTLDTGLNLWLDKHHPCSACFTGKINGFIEAKITFSIKIVPKILELNFDAVKWTFEPYICDFYVSVSDSGIECGLGKCPKVEYSVTFVVLDMTELPIEGADVSCSTGRCDADGDEKYDDTSIKTNEKGECVFYLKQGAHSVTISDSADDKTIDVNMIGTSRKISVILDNSTGGSVTPTPGIINKLTYTISNGKAAITDCSTSVSGTVILPSAIYGAPVTEIRDYAFRDCNNISSILIPDTVTSIGYNAFSGCRSLASIKIPDGVTSIGNGAFDNTSYYNSSSNWENGVLYIGNHLISAKTSISGAYKIKSGTITVADCAFDACASLTSVKIPDSVTSIGGYAFEGCTSLASIKIPAGVKKIASGAFRNCASLSAINVDSGNTEYLSVDGILFSKDKTELLAYPAGKGGTSYSIPNTVTAIGSWAFDCCKSFTSVTIPDSVTSIGGDAFYNCTSLASITIPDSVTSIGDEAFDYCTSLASIKIPAGVKKIASGAFRNCASLSAINVDSGNTEYLSVDGILFSKDKTELLAYPAGKGGTAYSIPNTVTAIGSYAFYACTSLTSVTIPDGVTSIGYSTFCECTSLKSITIPDSVTSIGEQAFTGCYSLASITIPAGVTSIGYRAFSGCTSLTSITIPDSVTSIGEYAFYNCTSLASVTIPESVTKIGNSAFYNTAMLVVYYSGTQEQWKKISISSNNSKLTGAKIHYGSSVSAASYKAAKASAAAFSLRDSSNTVYTASAQNAVPGELYMLYAFSNGTDLSSLEYVAQLKADSNEVKFRYIPRNSGELNVIIVGKFGSSDAQKPIEPEYGVERLELINAPTNTEYDYLSSSAVDLSGLRLKAFYSDGEAKEVTAADGVTASELDTSKLGEQIIQLEYEGAFLNITIKITPRKFNVTWKVDGVEDVKKVTENTAIALPEAPTKTGYSFKGWSPKVPDSMPANDMTFTAVFEANIYNAVFNADGGKWSDNSSKKTIPTAFDAKIEVPVNPTKQGYVFSKWNVEPGKMDSVNGKNFTAVWIPATDTHYTVETYTMNTSGEYDKTVRAFTGTTDSTAIAEYTVPTGFTLNSEKSELSGEIKANRSLVLKVYIDRNKYAFTTVVDGTENTTEYYYGSLLTEPAAPTKGGYKFVKWNGDIPETMPAKSVRITAEFIKSYSCPDCGNEILGEDAINAHIAEEKLMKSTVTIKNNSGSKTINYGETLRLTAIATMPADAKIVWYVDGVKKGEGKTFDVKFDSGTKTVEAKLVDANGNVLKDKNGNEISTAEKVTVNAGLWQKIVSFFKNLFGSDRTVVQ